MLQVLFINRMSSEMIEYNNRLTSETEQNLTFCIILNNLFHLVVKNILFDQILFDFCQQSIVRLVLVGSASETYV